MLSSGLLEILGDYGEVHVIGSYLLDLMVWCDLDIHIVRGPIDKPANLGATPPIGWPPLAETLQATVALGIPIHV